MFTVESDAARNVLTLRFAGDIQPAESLACLQRIRELLPTLKPGFTLFSDWSELGVMDLACAPHIVKSMDLCNEAGIGRIIRVGPDPRKDIGLNIMGLFHYRRRIPILTCETVAEAKKLLAE